MANPCLAKAPACSLGLVEQRYWTRRQNLSFDTLDFEVLDNDMHYSSLSDYALEQHRTPGLARLRHSETFNEIPGESEQF